MLLAPRTDPLLPSVAGRLARAAALSLLALLAGNAAIEVAAPPAAGAAIVRPPVRFSAGAAFDDDRGVLVLFGGWNGQPMGDTWEWNGVAWRLAASSGPQPRNAPAMAYDRARRRTVLFGGDVQGTCWGDTWEWNGTSWTRVPASGPAPRTLHRLAYSPAHGRVLLFGGVNGTTKYGDVWSWSGTAWTRLSNDGPARFLFGLAVDGDSRLVVYGGNPSPGDQYGHESDATWRWAAGAWDSVPTPGPGARDHVAIAHDAARGRTVLYGGAANGALFADLWEFDGERWSNVPFTGGPGPRSYPEVVYDSRNQVVLLHGGFDTTGGYDDLWAWNGATWRRVDDEAVPVLLRSFAIEPAEGALRVRWQLAAASADVTLERAGGAEGPWSEVIRLGAPHGARGEVLDRGADPERSWLYRLVLRSDAGQSILEAAQWPGRALAGVAIESVSPNPAAAAFEVRFALPAAGRARLTLCDLQGRAIAALRDGDLPAGRHLARWEGAAALAPGMYFVRLEAAGETRVRRIALAR